MKKFALFQVSREVLDTRLLMRSEACARGNRESAQHNRICRPGIAPHKRYTRV